MNIKIITRHAPSNYGSLLQSIATQKIIKRLGHDSEIIDYVRKDEEGLRRVLTSLANNQGWNNNLLKKFLYIVLRYPTEKYAEIRFQQMRERHLKLTPRYNTIEQLKNLKADLFMTGSDQVWGKMLCGSYDEAYFLTFAKDTRKVAFAASLGRTKFTDEIASAYKKMLGSYDAITVREEDAVKTLADWNIECLGNVLDPTLLLSADEWSEFIDKEIKGKYVLIYQIHYDKNLDNYAKKFAEHVGLPLLRMSPALHQGKKGGKFIYLPNIGEFLAYVKNCSYFITDSFHGTSFAINFNRQFIEILRDDDANTRHRSILQFAGLENRIVTDYNDFSIAEKKIDFQEVNRKMNIERERCIRLLKQIIEK